MDLEGGRLALSRGKTIAVLRASNLGVVRSFNIGDGAGDPMAMALAGRFLAVAPAYGALQILDTVDGRVLATISMNTHSGEWRDLAFDGRYLVAVGVERKSNGVDLWRVEA